MPADNGKHDPIGQINKFCPVRGNPTCECPKKNDYQKNCKPSWAGGAAEQRYAVGTKGITHGWEAHHVLSISCVNWKPKQSNKQKALLRVLRETDWCINKKDNMLAMPKFGQTVMYYTDISDDSYYVVDFGPPPFKNIPQHDFEHNTEGGYCSEVKTDIMSLWNDVAKAQKKHTAKAEGIEGRLDSLSEKWQGILEDRGMRLGGTHRAWKKGMKNPSSNWYLPFSMANDVHAEERHFTWTEEVNEKMRKIQEALRAAGR